MAFEKLLVAGGHSYILDCLSSVVSNDQLPTVNAGTWHVCVLLVEQLELGFLAIRCDVLVVSKGA